MTKSISSFREEDYGLFIDLGSSDGRIGVDRSTGDILLDEGRGADRYHGAAIGASSFRRFELRPIRNGSCELILHFGESGVHGLGETHDAQAAKQWVLNATRLIRAHVPIHAAPELRSEISIFSDAVRIMHPPSNYGEFQPRPELEHLDKWAQGNKRVCVVRGASGSGKSTLATHFMLSACPGSIAGYREAHTPFQSAFYFSFYDDPQPTHFLHALGRWLNQDKASRTSIPQILRSLLRTGPALIVLDGIEAIDCRDQHATVTRFVKAVTENTTVGVRLLLTTRDHKLFEDQRSAEFIVLRRLSQDVAIALLRSRGVDGEEQTLRRFAQALDYHPISLDMAGHCIREFGWQKNWSTFLEATRLTTNKSVTTTLNFDAVVRNFIDRLTEAAPPATQLLDRLHKASFNATAQRESSSSDFWQEQHDIVSWCLDLLRRANVITSFVERNGYVGAASGGSARYQFEPEIRLRSSARPKVLLQSSRFFHADQEPTSDSMRERVAGWLPTYLSTGKRS